MDIFIPRKDGAAAFEREVRKARVDVLDATALDALYPSLPEIMKVLERARIPAHWVTSELVRAGGLVSVTASMGEAYREAFRMAALILRGADPATMPVRTPLKFVTAINLRTARAMGLAVPPSVLLRADVVVE